MTYTITSQCIGCQRCLSACPTGAIQTDGTKFWIEIDRCNHCVGAYQISQCWAVCPTNEGCVPLSTSIAAVTLTSRSEASEDYWESWLATHTRMIAHLQASKQSPYWRHWFDAYSRALKGLQTAVNDTQALPQLL